MTDRTSARNTFLAAHGWPASACSLLADDASFRRYFRLQEGWRRAILMDAPPDKEQTAPFVTIARHLTAMDLSAPDVQAWDRDNGFVILEDLGDDTFTRMLAQGGDEATLYAHALEALIALHRRCPEETISALAPYGDDAFLAEAALFTDWYLPAVSGRETDEVAATSFQDAWKMVLPMAYKVPRTLVLRDYHVDNLMWLPERDGPRAIGLLDFQDALAGPVTYDLASLFMDARRDVSQEMAAPLLERYLALFPEIDREAFEASYSILAAQRTVKIIGIFTRLDRRDGKARYLTHIPRLWRLMDSLLPRACLTPVAAWFDRHVPAEMRTVPEAKGQ